MTEIPERPEPAALSIRPVLIGIGVLVAVLGLATWLLPIWLKGYAIDWIAGKTGHQLAIKAMRFDPLTLSIELDEVSLKQPDGAPLLALKALKADLSASSIGNHALALDEIRIDEPVVQLELLASGGLNWSAFIAALQPAEPQPREPGLPRFEIDRLVVKGGRVGFVDHTRPSVFSTTLAPLDLDLTNVSSLPDEKGQYRIAAKTSFGAAIDWRGTLTLAPVAVTGRIAVTGLDLAPLTPYLQAALPSVLPAGVARFATDYRVTWRDEHLGVQLDKLAAGIDHLALKSASDAAPALSLARVDVQAGQFDLAQRKLSLGQVEVADGRIAVLRRADGRLDVADWLPPPAGKAPAVAAVPDAPATSPAATTPAPWAIELGQLAVSQLALRVDDHTGGAHRQLEVGQIDAALSAALSLGGERPAGTLRDGRLSLAQLRVALPPAAPLTLKQLAVADVAVDLGTRRAEVGAVTLSGGQLAATRGRDGQIDLLTAVSALAGAPSAGASSAPRHAKSGRAGKGEPAAPTGPAPWQYRVGRVELADFAVLARDESVQPAAQLKLEQLRVRVDNLSQDLNQALPLSAGVKIAGGSLSADGRVTPAGPGADLKLTLSGLPLKLAQPYLSALANLSIADGRLSAQGQTTLDSKGPRFRGGFAVAGLRLVEPGNEAPLLAWRGLSAKHLTVTDKALDIPELMLAGLDARLHIAADKTVNVTQVLKRRPTPVDAAPPAGAEPAAAPAPTPAAKPAPAGAPPAFAVNIERLQIKDGGLDFADQSLALPFGTRIHDLAGAINGLSSRPGLPGQVELDGQVDDYGLARAAGQADFFRPTEFMDLKVVFRNVEMSRLTPYTATFAGRKIDAGKLSLDLEYKIDKRQLKGDNQIVMQNLTLGERIESPTAKNLPLDFAIALLQDSDGKIDLGLPISGSLDDPQFSYGALVWKAIFNVITKIATAPFRALGALFGGGEKFEQIAFEPGASALTPPEREKVVRLAEALKKRPQLALTVHGMHADADRAALQDLQLRQALARRTGLTVADGDDPGPISTRQPKVQEALEKLFAERLGGGELAALKDGFRKANPGQLEEGVAGKMMSRLSGLFREQRTLGEAELASLKGTDFHVVLYQRLRQGESVSEARLAELAGARGAAVVAALTAAGAPAERVSTAPAEKIQAEGRDIPVKLVLGTAKAG